MLYYDGSWKLKKVVIILTVLMASHTVIKVSDFPVPSQDATDQTLPGREYFNYSRPESLVGDIPAGDGKIAILFLQCM